MFSEGREDVNDEESAGRPSTSTTDANIDEVKKIVLVNRQITIREIEDLNISIGSCHSIFTIVNFYNYQMYLWFLIILFPIALVWFRISLAETNRTPFDFAEGESELVSGFNVEYRRGGFALIFLAEYARILFISILFCVIFLGCDVFNLIFILN